MGVRLACKIGLWALLATASAATPWPEPDPRFRPIFHTPSSGPGYVGDPNGLMFRRVPWHSSSDDGGLFHMFWQCILQNGDSLSWCHAASADFVHWAPLPPAFGGGAESGGAAQLDDGDVVAIFNLISKGGHWAARPLNRSDPLLVQWNVTNPVPKLPGTDLAGAFSDGPGLWKVVTDAHEMSGGLGGADIYQSADLELWEPQGNGTLHQYKWSRCTEFAAECGFHPYPCDPGLVPLPGTGGVWLFYGMQKTCGYSGREFYALGRRDPESKEFKLLDPGSDVGNNLLDGGDGYATMTVHDPRGVGRRLAVNAVIEGDRDPSTHSGFWTQQRGWFGVLSLPKVLELSDFAQDDGSSELFLSSPPLPELAALREPGSLREVAPLATADADVFSGKSVEVLAEFGRPGAPGWEVALDVLSSRNSQRGASEAAEYTRVGMRDATVMHGTDLWDEVNGDFQVLEHLGNWTECRGACDRLAACGAWSSSAAGTCRLKRRAARSILVRSNASCFKANYGDRFGDALSTVSGMKQQKSIQFAVLYVTRAHSWNVDPGCNRTDCQYGHSELATVVRLLPNETSLQLHVFVDRSIVELFGQRGRAVVTARVYPTLDQSQGVSLAQGSLPAVRFQAWRVRGNQIDASNLAAGKGSDAPYADPRDIHSGSVVLQEKYTDQPYCVTNSKTNEWTCVVTASEGTGEGGVGERCVSVVSSDSGKTWQGPFTIEEGLPQGLPNAYANIVLAPTLGPKGRVYTIYNLNLNNISAPGRVDELGFFYMRYSDDGGRTWSRQRYAVPYRDTWVDRHNIPYNGSTRIMWTVDQVKVKNGTAYFAFTKIGRYVQNPPEEVFVLASDNLLVVSDPGLVTWRLLPGGDHGIKAPVRFDPNTTVMEEGHVLPLQRSEGFYVMARTDKGYLAATTCDAALDCKPTGLAQYWDVDSSPHALVPMSNITNSTATFVAGVKNTRGPFTPKWVEFLECYLMLFYNNRGGANDRNPYWLSAGFESASGAVLWSQPEIAIYDRVYHNGTSGGGYPDFIESGGALYFTTAQKGLPTPSVTVLLPVDGTLLSNLHTQRSVSGFPKPAAVLSVSETDRNSTVPCPGLPSAGGPSKTARQGLSMSLWLQDHNKARPGQTILGSSSGGIRVLVGPGSSLEVSLRDGAGVSFSLETDPSCTAMLLSGGPHFVGVVADAGPSIMSILVDGVMCDGGGLQTRGFNWLPQTLGALPAIAAMPVNPDYTGWFRSARVYATALYTSELIGEYRHGLQPEVK